MLSVSFSLSCFGRKSGEAFLDFLFGKNRGFARTAKSRVRPSAPLCGAASLG
jgi:hypothetical protein